MSGQNEEAQHFRGIMRQNILNQKEVPQGLAHFFLIYRNKAVMKPVAHKRGYPRKGLRLGHFIFMMRENQITAAAMKIKLFTQVFMRHGRAFNMPTRPSCAPGAFP